MKSSLLVALVLISAATLALELGISSAILEIVAGAALAFFIDDISELGWLEFLANLGMLGLMFMAGFEVESSKLKKNWKASVGVGGLSFFVPFTGLFVTCYYLLDLSAMASGLVAIGLSTTSLALVFQALKERELLDGSLGQTMLAAASVVDVLSMVSLAFLMGHVGWGTAVFLLVIGPMLVALPKAGKWLFRRYENSIVELELRFILVLLVAMGFMAEELGGLHPAIIAFAIGLVLSEVVEEHGELEEKLKGIVFSFFGPVFFLHAGAQLDLSLMTPDLLWQVGLLLVITVGLKYAGTALPARRLMETTGHFVGTLFTYQLTFGIIAATVGLETGVIDEELYAVMLVVVVGSAALPVIFLRSKPHEL